MTILDRLLSGFKKEKPLMTNDEINKIIRQADKLHYGGNERTKHNWSEWWTPYRHISNALSCLHINGCLNRGSHIKYNSFWENYAKEFKSQLFKLRNVYEISKVRRKHLHSENLKLKAKIERLDKGRLNRLEKIGDMMSRLKPNMSINRNHYGDWVISSLNEEYNSQIHVSKTAPDGIYKDLLVALKELK